MAIACHSAALPSPGKNFTVKPSSDENAPLRSFSSAYQGRGLPLTRLSHALCRRGRDLDNFLSLSWPRQYARTSIFAQTPEKDVSVAPSATAKLNASAF